MVLQFPNAIMFLLVVFSGLSFQSRALAGFKITKAMDLYAQSRTMNASRGATILGTSRLRIALAAPYVVAALVACLRQIKSLKALLQTLFQKITAFPRL